MNPALLLRLLPMFTRFMGAERAAAAIGALLSRLGPAAAEMLPAATRAIPSAVRVLPGAAEAALPVAAQGTAGQSARVVAQTMARLLTGGGSGALAGGAGAAAGSAAAGAGAAASSESIAPAIIKMIQGVSGVTEAAPATMQAASEGGTTAAAETKGAVAKIWALIKKHPYLSGATALPIAGMMLGRGEDDRRSEMMAMQGGEGGGMQKDLKNALMLMQLSKLMQRAQDNSQELTLPAGMRTPDDAMMLM